MNTERNLGHPASTTLSFSPKEGILLTEEAANWASPPGMVRARGSSRGHCLSCEEGTTVSGMLVSVMVNFTLLTWLGYGT